MRNVTDVNLHLCRGRTMNSAGLQPGCRTGLQARTGYFTSQRIVETGLTKLAMGDRKIPFAEAGQAPAQGAVNPRFGETRIRTRRLPHWEKDEGLYFVTFRLADSLPRQVIERMMERHRILRAAKENGAHLLPHQKTLIAEFSSAKIEEYFDRGIGACHLRDPRIANLVANTLRLRHACRMVHYAEPRSRGASVVPWPGAGRRNVQLEVIYREDGKSDSSTERCFLAAGVLRSPDSEWR